MATSLRPSRMTRARATLVSLAAVVLLVGLAAVATAAGKAGHRAPDFSLAAEGGGTVKLSGLRGKVVLVDFWASWCKPCKKELPELDKLAKAYKDAGADVVVLAVNIDTKRDNALKFLKSAKIQHLTVLYDPSSTVAEQFDPPTMPTSYVIDRKGIVKVVHEGYKAGDEKKVKAEIDALLKAP
jgi:thiol-disulfide isomerase/thioredoxin